MLERIIRASIAHRWLVLLLVLAPLSRWGSGTTAASPIDAIPDITNVQVQINTEAPGYSPMEAEQRHFPRLRRRWLASLGSTTPARFPATVCRRSLRSLRTAPTFTLPVSRVAERLQQASSQLPAGLNPSRASGNRPGRDIHVHLGTRKGLRGNMDADRAAHVAGLVGASAAPQSERRHRGQHHRRLRASISTSRPIRSSCWPTS